MAGMVSVWHSSYRTGFLHRLSASLWNRGGCDEAGNYSIPCRHDDIASSSGAPQGDPLVDVISGLRFTSCPQGKENKERHATATSCSGGFEFDDALNGAGETSSNRVLGERHERKEALLGQSPSWRMVN